MQNSLKIMHDCMIMRPLESITIWFYIIYMQSPQCGDFMHRPYADAVIVRQVRDIRGFRETRQVKRIGALLHHARGISVLRGVIYRNCSDRRVADIPNGA